MAKDFLQEAYADIRTKLKDVCNTDDVAKQEQKKGWWSECIDHHDYERITGPIAAIEGILDMIDRMEPEGRDEEFEKRAREWLEVVHI